MLGGYQILDLSGMSLPMGSDVSISDLNVLKQLLVLREHIEENFNYSKPLNKRLKAVMIRLRDAESGEKTEGCLWGNLSIIDDNLSFNIDAVVSVNPLKVLQINVIFEKKQDDDGNDYYDIKSAKYEFRGGEDVVTVTNIKNIPSAIINKLDCGDIVLKKDSSGLHAYIVSFRNATGICLTYADASCIETQSYDKVGQNWVYNSEDKSGNLIDDVKPIYWHSCSIKRIDTGALIYFADFIIINNSRDPITKESFVQWLRDNPDIEIKVVQGYDYSHPNSIMSYIKIQSAESTAGVFHSINTTTGAEETSNYNLAGETSVFTDNGVNKIN